MIFYTDPQSHYTEKAGSKSTGMASKVARQGYTLRKIWTRKRARRQRIDKGRHCRALRKPFGRSVRQQRTRDLRKSWYTSTCFEYVQKECVGTWRSRSAERGLREWRTNYSSRRSRRIWDYLFKRRRSCSQAQLQEVYHSFLPSSSFKRSHSWKIIWVWDGWNSQKKIPLYTRLGPWR